MLSINGYSNYYQPQFKARLNMPPKEVFEKYAGKFCAEQAEIARPAIEKIAKEADEIVSIDVSPSYMKKSICLPSIHISALSKRGETAGWPYLEPEDANPGQKIAEFLTQSVKEAIEGAEDGGWLT